MSAREFRAWQIYFQREPMREERADMRAGMIAWTTAVATSGDKKLRVSDFVPKWGPKRKLTVPEMMNHFRCLAIMRGGTVKDGDHNRGNPGGPKR